MSNNNELFQSSSGFCADCGSILPPLGEVGDVKCYACERTFAPDALGNGKVKYTIYFNSIEACERDVHDGEKRKEEEENEEDGPIVERKCPNCGNEKMSYATLQLRSADEGQTVFYTCTKCKLKETENS